MTDPRPKLTYFDYPGLAESIRITLRLGKIDFEDNRVNQSEMEQLRLDGSLPTGQLPILEIGEIRLSQSEAILRWVGNKTGHYPKDELLAVRCDMILGAVVDIRKYFAPQWYGHALGRSPVTSQLLVALSSDQKAEISNKLNSEVLPELFTRLENLLGDEPYFCGRELMICDIEVYCVITGLLDGTSCKGVSPSVLDHCPKLLDFADRVREMVLICKM
jgi:prostaglandin-H2 D-isomerase / glutathione transferase